ncbi:helix-turn-helix domain-containing protein [Chryseobacterium tongliaoense]|uniref:helix-turn-helix domain-containing protein n=1 Tax=Chryseobacterium tongliaoense TaxID=3240933 RepID=UPI0035136CB3
MKNVTPDYKRIYIDIIEKKFPQKRKFCEKILNKSKLSILDIIQLNALIFEHTKKETSKINQQLRSYDQQSIFEILEYQKKNNYSNTQLAQYFKLSRNTVAKWKKLYT